MLWERELLTRLFWCACGEMLSCLKQIWHRLSPWDVHHGTKQVEPLTLLQNEIFIPLTLH